MTAITVRSAAEHDLYSLNIPGLLHKPGFALYMLRIAEDHGKAVGTLLTERFTLIYGRARLRVVGISLHHNDDLAVREALIHDALAAVVEQGAHIALVHDPLGHFSTYGFTPVWPYYRMTFATADAMHLPGADGWRLRPARKYDVPQMATLYEKHWTGRITLARSPELWLWRVANDSVDHILVAVDPDDQVQGYIAGDDLTTEQVEILVETPQAAVVILTEAAQQHQHINQPVVSWFMPPDDHVVHLARRLLDVSVYAAYQHNGGWLGRLIDSPALVEALLPEITAQAQTTTSDFDPSALQIRCDRDRVHIGLRHAPTTHGALNHQDFIQIMFGMLSPDALAQQENLRADHLQLLHTLFPPRIATLGCWDWF